jgi:probable F420-dependent oxidoreductase
MAAPIKVGINIVFVKPDSVVEISRAAEDLGFESVWSGEHVSLPVREDWWRSYPSVVAAGEAGHEKMVPFKPSSVFVDPMTVLAFVASATKTIRLGIGIYLLALRNPILVGRTIATLDILSGGRLDLGVGLGWTPWEYEFTENDWKTRARRLDESIRCLRALFEEDEPEFHGEFFDFPKIGFQPKPLQKPLPIHVGGSTAAAVRRAVALGDGWYGGDAFLPQLRQGLAEQGRDPKRFQLSTIQMGAAPTRADLEGLAEKGVERIVVVPWRSRKPVGPEGVEILQAYAREIGL